jgi:hypothetical protein
LVENFQQTLIFIFQSNLDLKIFIAITIVIEKVIRIDRPLIEKFLPDPDVFWGGVPLTPLATRGVLTPSANEWGYPSSTASPKPCFPVEFTSEARSAPPFGQGVGTPALV